MTCRWLYMFLKMGKMLLSNLLMCIAYRISVDKLCWSPHSSGLLVYGYRKSTVYSCLLSIEMHRQRWTSPYTPCWSTCTKNSGTFHHFFLSWYLIALFQCSHHSNPYPSKSQTLHLCRFHVEGKNGLTFCCKLKESCTNKGFRKLQWFFISLSLS